MTQSKVLMSDEERLWEYFNLKDHAHQYEESQKHECPHVVLSDGHPSECEAAPTTPLLPMSLHWT